MARTTRTARPVPVDDSRPASANYHANALARGLALRSYAHTLTLGVGRQSGAVVDLTTEDVARGPSTLANVLLTARRLHETLLLDARWLVTASTIAMLALIVLGIFMGLPRLRNTVAGWHKATAWILLPLVVLSSLTALAMAFGVTFTAPLARDGGTPSVHSDSQYAASSRLSGPSASASRARSW